MKKITQFCAAGLMSAALIGSAAAATPGTYVGLGLGVSKLDTPNSYLFDITGGGETSRERGGLGGRVFGGYNFNKYFGVETGLAQYAQSKYKASNLTGSSSIDYTMKSLDVVGKGYLPIQDSGFNLYGLAGLAYVRDTVKFNNGNVPLANGVTAPRDGSHTVSKVRPKFGVGASYDINQNVTTSLELSRIEGRGNVKTNSNAIPNADMMTLNISYNFN